LTEKYNNLKEFNGSAPNELLNQIKEFRTLYENHRDEITKSFHNIDEIESNIACLQIAWKHWFDFHRVKETNQSIIPQPADGNCWLHTSVQALAHLNLINSSVTYLTLRGSVVDWMQGHYAEDETLRRFVDDGVEAYKAFGLQSLDSESINISAIAEFCSQDEVAQARANLNRSRARLQSFSSTQYWELMRQVGSHGGHAEFYAISRLYRVNVAIWREIPAWNELPARLTRCDEQIQFPGAMHTINAVLTGGNHFNYLLPWAADELAASEDA
jgi:hypothetical protein